MDMIRKKYKDVTRDQSDGNGLTGWQYWGSMISGSYFLQKERGRISAFARGAKKQPASMRQPVSHLRLESFLYMREKILLI